MEAGTSGVTGLGHPVRVVVEEPLVGLNGIGGQVHTVGAQLKGGARLVEADVAVVADAQQLQVDTAHVVDDLVVTLALGRGVQVGAVGQVDAGGVDVDVVKEIVVHEAPVALGILTRQTAVFVQVDGGHFRKVHVALVVPVDQLLIGAHGGAAGGQAQHAVGFHDDLGRDNVGRFAGHILVVFCADDLHRKCNSFSIAGFAREPVSFSSIALSADGVQPWIKKSTARQGK